MEGKSKKKIEMMDNFTLPRKKENFAAGVGDLG